MRCDRKHRYLQIRMAFRNNQRVETVVVYLDRTALSFGVHDVTCGMVKQCNVSTSNFKKEIIYSI